MLCEHRWETVLAGTAEKIVEAPLKVCAICGSLKIGDRIVSPGLQIEEIAPEPGPEPGPEPESED
ncbi:hypothetical protein ES703_06365 [subsurface metagenome]